jgi:acyl-CoA reductase-like NAD-dependent aldehyde dehydrogenase
MTGNHYIDGHLVAGDNRLEVRNPAVPSEVIGTIALATSDQVAEAVGAAERVRTSWRDLGAIQRGTLLFKAADRLEEHAEELAQLASREMGKPIGETRGEAMRAVAILRYYAGEGYRAVGEVIPAANPATLQYTTRDPLGVVAVITPWNFPLAIPMWKIAPALIYGNTVVFKPAEWASLTAFRLVELVGPLLPAGVLNLVLGLGRDVGESLIRQRGIDGISFTGSAGVGAHIAEVATQNGVKYQAEMGGKNPVIVARDANLDLALELTVSGAMRSAGQKCTATSRVIVEDPVHDVFVERLAERVRSLRVGNPLDPDTYLGPVVSEPQQQKIMHLIKRGRDEGGHLVVGGEPMDQDGYYVAPTVFDGVAPDSAIAQEEIFGPVVGVIAVSDIDAAIQVANQIRYGLSASVFTQNLSVAMRFVRDIVAGLVRVNEETAGVELQAPFGGMKASSSHSREQGRAAMEFYTQIRTVAIRGL